MSCSELRRSSARRASRHVDRRSLWPAGASVGRELSPARQTKSRNASPGSSERERLSAIARQLRDVTLDDDRGDQRRPWSGKRRKTVAWPTPARPRDLVDARVRAALAEGLAPPPRARARDCAARRRAARSSGGRHRFRLDVGLDLRNVALPQQRDEDDEASEHEAGRPTNAQWKPLTSAAAELPASCGSPRSSTGSRARARRRSAATC